MTRWDDLFNSPPEPDRPVASVTTLHLEPGRASSYAAAALRREAEQVAAAANGTRNDTLNRAAFNMGRHIGAGSIDPALVRATLADAARACGLGQDEIDLVLRDNDNAGLTQGATSPRHPDPLPDIPRATVFVPPEDEPGDDITELIRSKFPLLDWHDLWSREDEDEDWIIEPLLPARRLIALYSAPKVGKSLLMLEVAVAVARGIPVLGVTPDRARRVLYVDFENDPRGDVRERLLSMDQKPEDLGNLCYLSYPTLAKLDSPTGALELMAIVKTYECEVVVIDTISRAVGGEENENDTWLAFYRNTGLALKQAGVACIRLDHTGKDHDKGMRGGSAKYGDVDAVWKLSRVTEETFRLECTDHRMPVPTTAMTLLRQDFPLMHKVAGDGLQAMTDAKVRMVDENLDRLGVASSASVREAAEALRGAGVKVENRAVRDAVKLRKMRLDVPVEPISEVFDPARSERLAPAWDAALRHLSDGDWHPRGEVIDIMLSASDLVAKTCSNRLSEAVRSGALEQRGEYPDWELRTFPGGVPGTPPAHLGTPGVDVPGTAAPERGRAAHSGGRAETARHTSSDDPDEQVSCVACFKPTTRGVAASRAGRCATCPTPARMTTPTQPAETEESK